METLINNEWLQLFVIAVFGVLIWKLILKSIFLLSMKYIVKFNGFLQPLKCTLGKHDKEYGMPSEVAGTRVTRIKCKNPDCSWESQESEVIF